MRSSRQRKTNTKLPHDTNLYLGDAVLQFVKPLAKQSPLHDDGGQQEVEPDSAEPVPLQERHQEPEPDEYHHVDVLKH